MIERSDDILVLARQHIFLVRTNLIEASLNDGPREHVISCHANCYDTFSDTQERRLAPLHILENTP